MSSYKEFDINIIEDREYGEEEINSFEKLGKAFINNFIEKPKEIRKTIINENKKEIREQIDRELEIGEEKLNDYVAVPGGKTLFINLWTMLITAPGVFVTNFGEKFIIVETNRRLIIITVGNFFDFMESWNIRYKNIEEVRIDRESSTVAIKRFKIKNIKEYFFPVEWRIPRFLKFTVTSKNKEKLFKKLQEVKIIN